MDKRCERARRDDGLPVRLICDICHRGPCSRRNVPIEPPPILNVHMWGVPQRLKGATINSEGDAV
jgi:hypothetical protein